MKIIVNGKEQDLKGDSLSLLHILTENNVKKPEMVSVQLNGEFIDQDNFNHIFVKEKDEVDFLYFMGGGSNGN
jgi:sulfur carrier protein